MRQTLLPPRMDIVPSLDEHGEHCDRCDRCAAAAKLRLILIGGHDLVFCGHHANRLADDILRQAVKVTLAEGFDWWGGARSGC